jgi:hypothetical protein
MRGWGCRGGVASGIPLAIKTEPQDTTGKANVSLMFQANKLIFCVKIYRMNERLIIAMWL